jgi:hypothetical protein
MPSVRGAWVAGLGSWLGSRGCRAYGEVVDEGELLLAAAAAGDGEPGVSVAAPDAGAGVAVGRDCEVAGVAGYRLERRVVWGPGFGDGGEYSGSEGPVVKVERCARAGV